MAEKISPEYYDVSVGAIRDFGNETRDFELRYEPGKSMRFVAGQFVSVVLPKGDKVVRRAYSIASPPEQKDRLNLVIKRVEGGEVTRWFWSLRSGDRFRIHGPFGKFVLPDPVDFDPVFVATGTGVAPFRSMIHSLLSAGFRGKISLLFGARYDAMIPYHEEWTGLAGRHPQFVYVPTVSRPGPGWSGATGYVQAHVRRLLGPPGKTRVYICGLNEMIQPVKEACLQAGLPQESISYEKYD